MSRGRAPTSRAATARRRGLRAAAAISRLFPTMTLTHGPAAGDGTSWGDPNNWNDLTKGENPAQNAPGSGDDVTFGVAADISDFGDAYSILNSAALTISGNVGAQFFTDTDQVEVTGLLATLGLLQEQGAMTVAAGGEVQAFGATSARRRAERGQRRLRRRDRRRLLAHGIGRRRRRRGVNRLDDHRRGRHRRHSR